MTYIYTVYLIISIVITLLLNNFFSIFTTAHSWWSAPLLAIGIFLGLVIIQLLVLVLLVFTTNTAKPVSFKKTRFFRAVLNASLLPILKLMGIRITFEGGELLPKDKRFLLLCNHQQDFDPAIIISQLPDSELAFIGKKEIYTEMKFVSQAMHLIRSLPINRENDREAAKTIIKAVNTIKNNEASIAIFPEGYTNTTPEKGLLPFRNGCLKIATKSGAPIVVCVVNNTRQIPKNIFRRRTYIDLKLIRVISPDEYSDLNTQELGDLIHKEMENALNDILQKKKVR